VYDETLDYTNALKNYLQAFAIKQQLSDKKGMAASYSNVGLVYKNMGNYSVALENYESSLKISEELNDKKGIARCKNLIGNVYLEQKKYKDAVKYFNESLSLRKDISDKEGVVGSSLNIGNLFLKQKQPEKAKAYLQKLLPLVKEVNNAEDLKTFHKLIMQADSFLGNWKSAFESQTKFIELRDSLNNKNNTKEITKKQMQFEFEKKQNQTEALQQKKDEQTKTKLKEHVVFRNALIIIVFLIIIFSIVFITSIRNRQKFEAMQALLKGQEEERKRIAEELHDGLGALLATLKININYLDLKPEQLSEQELLAYNTAKTLAEKASEEVHSISHNLLPPLLQHFGLSFALSNLVQQLNAANKTKFVLDYVMPPKRLTAEYELHIYRLVLELVQNIIKHANAAKATIHLIEQDNYLSLMVEDDGKGFDFQKNSNGLGLKNVLTRINILKGEMETDTQQGRGTTINIRLPKNYE
jgi:signal transduction histidine kinase